NQHAYEQTTSLKVEALSLVLKANEPYNNHEKEIEQFKLKMLKAHEYARGIPKNKEATEQWAILINPEGKSMFGFLDFWKKNNEVSEMFAKEYKKEIEKHFNEIIELETGKMSSGS
ncbi:MAG: hypothetical protein LJE89_01590, partial [Deltaproteobacteria bacterium]|nr:hypothetical protein [Deltaproteobacteria bacterium]